MNIVGNSALLDSVPTMLAIATGPIACLSLLLVESFHRLDILEVFPLIILFSQHLVSCSTFDVILAWRWKRCWLLNG